MTTQYQVFFPILVEVFSPYRYKFSSCPIQGFFPTAIDDPKTTEVLEGLCDRLRVTKLENEEISIGLDSVEDVVAKGKKCILMKLLSNHYHNREALKTTLTKV